MIFAGLPNATCMFAGLFAIESSAMPSLRKTTNYLSCLSKTYSSDQPVWPDKDNDMGYTGYGITLPPIK